MIEQIYNAIAKGGIIMIPIGIVSLFLWFFIFERLFFFRSQKAFLDYKFHSALEDFFKGDSKALSQFCENSHGGIIETLKNLLLSEPEGTAHVRPPEKLPRPEDSVSEGVGKCSKIVGAVHEPPEHNGAIRELPLLRQGENEASEPRPSGRGLEIELSFKQIFQQEYPKFYRNLGIISVLISIAPLLGLLGTIYGLLIVFNVITIHGIGDVNQLSGGIAQALITTEAGLIVALPALFIHSRLEDKAENMVREFKRILIQIPKQT